MLPKVYIDAASRNVTPFCPARNRFGVGFNLPNGEVLRLALDLQGAQFLRDSLAVYISDLAVTQSSGLALIPSVPMSVPSDGVKV